MSKLAPALALALSACGLGGFERGFAATAPTDLHFGGRVWAGMPRGQARLWVTELAFVAHTDGFFAAAGGVGVRAPRGVSPRAAAAFGVGARSLTGDAEGRNGLGPYVEGQLGVDVALDPGTALVAGALASSYLNGDELEHHLMAMVGLVWR